MTEVSPEVARPDSPSVRSSSPERSLFLDTLRGGLVILMIVYHAAYNAVLVGLLSFELYEGFWWIFPRIVAAGFICVSGWNLAAKKARGGDIRTFLRRAGRLALPALTISLISLPMFRQGFVFFGILHLLAVSTILAWPFLGKPGLGLVAGIACLAGGLLLGEQRFSWPYLAWLGFRPEGLYPVDYLPLLPWFAWCLFGAAARDLSLRHISRGMLMRLSPSVARPPNTGLRLLAGTGRHSLLIYLVHLPVLYGLARLLVLLKGF